MLGCDVFSPFSPEERLLADTSLRELRDQQKLEALELRARVNASERDYIVACGYGRGDALRGKVAFYR